MEPHAPGSIPREDAIENQRMHMNVEIQSTNMRLKGYAAGVSGASSPTALRRSSSATR